MRNLRTIAYSDTSFEEDLPLTATAWDTNNDCILYAFGPTPSTSTIELKRRRWAQSVATTEGDSNDVGDYVMSSINSWDAPCPLPDLDCDKILLMHHFSDTATTCIILAGGDLILVREELASDEEAIEIVGSIDVGIAAAAWAPDEELLALITRTNNLILMSRHLEPVNETQMTADDMRMSTHVSVGWGKKETQFQGKRAKAMRDPTMPEHVDEGKPSSREDGSVSISWRGDGAFLAVNSMVPDHRRAIRVYSREGALDSVSEPVDGLESTLSWRPYGNLIAGIRRVETGSGQELLETIFFERNGLRHGEFKLRLTADEVKREQKITLGWNIDSSVLAVALSDSVQFWTMGNYHYYLKKEIRIGNASAKHPVRVTWHPERALQCLIEKSDRLIDVEYSSKVCMGSTVVPYDFGIVAVIDGSILKLTPLKHAGVPPPMAFCELDAGVTITDCAISRDGTLIAVLSHDNLQIFEWERVKSRNFNSSSDSRHTTNIRKITSLTADIPSLFGAQACTQICFQNNNEIYILAPGHNVSHALCYRLMFDTIADKHFKIKQSILIPRFSRNIISDVHRRSTCVQDGSSMRLISSSSQDSIEPIIGNGQPDSAIFEHMAVEASGINGYNSASHHQACLTTKGSLYVNDRLVARDCTSFVITENHLVFTTSQHLLKFVHLTTIDQLDVPGDTPEIDERCRAVERGSKIVTVIPSIYAVVLQMPRGNLETIYPRVLVLSGIRKSLKDCEYRTAFLACQNHQVDMNILYDHLPGVFMSNLAKFINDLKKPSRIDEFLSKLKEENVAESLYKNTLDKSEAEVTHTSQHGDGSGLTDMHNNTSIGKVNRICDAFISVLNLNPTKYLQNVITAHVCKRPPDMTAALTLVSSLRNSSPEEADAAVSHLCFLTDTNRLYDAALSLYDLELTLLVAQNAQRDPREYMPFLQSLQALPSLRRQYQIDDHLRNYSKALVSLHSLKEHEEVQTYTIKHNLYTMAMGLYKYNPTHLPKITILYAEHLESLSQYASAATLYESLGDHASAYPLYSLAHQWREALTCATLVPLDKFKLQQLASSLATTCAEETRDYRAVATIHADYLQDIPTAARFFCKGSYFADAARILALHGFGNEILTIIDPGLTEKFGEIIELVADCKSQLSAQVARIIELRRKKEEDPLAFYGGDAAAMAADGYDIPDNISIAATDTSTVGGQSLFTRYGSNASKFGGTVASNVSRKTSRTKRREERKRARGKKGSVYEEEYLINSLGRLIERLNGVQDEVKRLTSGLLRRGLRDQAIKVDEVMAEISAMCEEARKEVWQVKDVTEQSDSGPSTYDVNGEGRPSGADGVLWDSQQELGLTGKKQAPELKKWTGSTPVLL